jgi:hypothetical protein
MTRTARQDRSRENDAEAAGEFPATEGFPAACADLSNDFLNHYSEVLMLIEMAGDEPAIAAELQEWRPVSYRAYFASSELRRAAAALAAYDALPEARRQAFEKLVASMDTLATMAVFALQPPSTPESAPLVVRATAPALRGIIARAATFLNSGGRNVAEAEGDEAQAVIDRIIDQAGA